MKRIGLLFLMAIAFATSLSAQTSITQIQARAEAGHAYSQAELGLLYLMGNGVAQNPQTAS